MPGRHAIAVGQLLLYFGDIPVAEREVLGHHAAEVEQIGRDGIHLFGGQRLGRIPWHGTVDVVPHSGDGGHLHEGGATRKGRVLQTRGVAGLDILLGGAANQRTEHLVGFAKYAMAGCALGLPNRLALIHRARSFGQALEVGAHVDIPGLHFLGRGIAAHAGELLGCALRQRAACQRAAQQQRRRIPELMRAGH
ncbi:hypothetical protein SDC9_153462 [bioreactor metagenome]|uniref:Uncharacterized protein n=1 Tax=bioreactor metagenome TaxID=1076179 RepID=A0A645EXR4_9ZZZZ